MDKEVICWETYTKLFLQLLYITSPVNVHDKIAFEDLTTKIDLKAKSRMYADKTYKSKSTHNLLLKTRN